MRIINWEPPNPSATQNNKSKGTIKGQARLYLKGHYNARVPLVERFWGKVNKDGPLPSDPKILSVHPDITGTQCWEWTGFIHPKGYGVCGVPPYKFTTTQRGYRAHRVAWFLETGEWPDTQALHKCDNRKCVRFSHLFEGNNEHNMRDKVLKGKQSRNCGEKAGNAVLTWAKVRSIRKVAKGITRGNVVRLANKYNVCETTISYVIKSKTWKESA